MKVHDTQARYEQVPLPEVRYDLQHSSAAMWHRGGGETGSNELSALIQVSRRWLQRRLGLQGSRLLDAEERIDLKTVERIENGLPTTCGGFLL